MCWWEEESLLHLGVEPNDFHEPPYLLMASADQSDGALSSGRYVEGDSVKRQIAPA